MKRVHALKVIALVGVLSASIALLSGCGSDPNSGVAATVNGTEISEATVTQEVAHVRAQSGLSDDEQWGKYLVQNDQTPESVRDTVIDNLVEQELLIEAAPDLGVEVTDEEVDEAVNKFKNDNYSSDEAWENALETAGFTEESYRKSIKGSMVQKEIGEHFEEQAEVTDEDYVNSAKTYASYYDGAKRTSHILFSVDNTSDQAAMDEAKATAEDVLARINDGSLSFEDAVSEYSGDESSKENGGDVGWDKLNSFVTEYTDAIADLHAGDMTPEPVQSQYGYHIIKVTEEFDAPEADDITSLDQIPEAFQENIKDMAVSVKANTLYTDWLDGVKENAEIEKNAMPEGLPYDIDLTKYEEEKAASDAAAESASADSASTGVTDTTSTDEAVTPDATATDATAADATVTDATATTDITATTDGTATTDAATVSPSDSTGTEAASSSESAATESQPAQETNAQ